MNVSKKTVIRLDTEQGDVVWDVINRLEDLDAGAEVSGYLVITQD